MSANSPSWSADPLYWGHGPRCFEAFLEPTCPFSARAFPKLTALVEHAGTENVTVKIRLHSQPWHLFSGIVTRTILAASTTNGGREAAHAVMQAVFSNRESFEFDQHCAGPNMDQTPNRLIARIEALTGLALAQPFGIAGLDQELKWHTKYARQNGIHVSPSFMVDGIVRADIGSGDPIEKWAEAISRL
jgi:hypothetical protein